MMVRWYKTLPTGWRETKLKYVATLQRVEAKSNDNYVGLENIESGTGSYIHSNTTPDGLTLAFQKGDVLFGKLRPYLAKCWVATFDGCCSSEFFVLRPKEVSSAYLWAILISKNFIEAVNGSSFGAKMPRASWDFVSEMSIPISEFNDSIARFIQDKVDIIENFVKAKKQLLSKLSEYRQSIITEAVTKGLNPKTALKKSGIQWVTDIPKHWKTINPKGYFRERKERATEGMIQCTASQKYGVIPQAEYMRLTGSRVVVVTKDFDILKAVHCGDFIIHMRSFQGGLELSTMDCCVSSAYVGLIPDNKAIVNEYFRWLFKCVPYIQALRNTSNLIRDGQAMRFWNFIQVPLILPPKDEQIAIAKYLTTTCEKIDRLSESINKTIVLLTKYRNSLITEAVTGQIDCTGN